MYDRMLSPILHSMLRTSKPATRAQHNKNVDLALLQSAVRVVINASDGSIRMLL